MRSLRIIDSHVDCSRDYGDDLYYCPDLGEQQHWFESLKYLAYTSSVPVVTYFEWQPRQEEFEEADRAFDRVRILLNWQIQKRVVVADQMGCSVRFKDVDADERLCLLEYKEAMRWMLKDNGLALIMEVKGKMIKLSRRILKADNKNVFL